MSGIYDRMLLDEGAPDAERFYITTLRGVRLAAFRTGGVNGKTAEDTAIGNAADLSERSDGPLFLHRHDGSFVARCEAGLIRKGLWADAKETT